MKTKLFLVLAILSGAIISFCDDQLDQEKTSQEAIDEYNKKARDEFQKLQKQHEQQMNLYSQRKHAEFTVNQATSIEDQLRKQNHSYPKSLKEIFNDNDDEDLSEFLKILDSCINSTLKDKWKKFSSTMKKEYPNDQELRTILQITNDNMFNLPRLALLLWMQLEKIQNEDFIKYGSTPAEAKITKEFLKAMRCKLIYFELLHNKSLTNKQRVEIFRKIAYEF